MQTLRKPSTNSMRIGPMSVLVLVILLSLSVLAVLSASIAQASYSEAQKQASVSTSTYSCEMQAQEFLAQLDTLLAKCNTAKKSDAYGFDELAQTLREEFSFADYEDVCDVDSVTASALATVEITQQDEYVRLSACFSAENNRVLNVEILIDESTDNAEANGADSDVDSGSDSDANSNSEEANSENVQEENHLASPLAAQTSDDSRALYVYHVQKWSYNTLWQEAESYKLWEG